MTQPAKSPPLAPDSIAATSTGSIPADAARALRKPQLPALTGLRTLLALSIVFFHFTPPHMRLFYPIIDNGFVFVGFFFLLSGYILAYNYADRPSLSKREFWVARFSRLYPVYLLALAVSFQMLRDEWHARSHTEFLQGLILTPLLLQGWLPSLATFWNTVGWTLSCEVMLYLAFPWLIRIPLPSRPARLIALLLALWAVGLIPHTLYILLNPDHLAAATNRYSSGFWIRLLKFTPPPYICTFLAGLTLGRLQSRLTLTSHHRLMLAAAALLALGVVFYILLPQLSYILLHGGLLIPLFALLTIGLSGPNLLSSAFSIRPLVFIGQATFCLYLLHFNAMLLIRSTHLIDRLHLAAFDPWLTYAIVVLLALAAHRFVETPARKAILYRFGPKPSSAKADTAPALKTLSFSGR